MQTTQIRILSFHKTSNGNNYFDISSEKGVIYTSDLYDNLEECRDIGMKILDDLHEDIPIKEERKFANTLPARNTFQSKKVEE